MTVHEDTKEKALLLELSHRLRPTDPRLKGRDPSNPYYDFLYHLTSEMKPKLTVELGTCNGFSAIHLACGYPAGKLISVDIEQHPEVLALLAEYENIEAIQSDSTDPALVQRLKSQGPIDILFIDTLHEGDWVEKELSLYLPLVRPGGVILFDDIRINESMAAFWEELTLDKMNLNHLHQSGFGAAIAH